MPGKVQPQPPAHQPDGLKSQLMQPVLYTVALLPRQLKQTRANLMDVVLHRQTVCQQGEEA